jgi:hypothetical protein
MKKTIVLMAIIVLVLAACTPKATPLPVEVPLTGASEQVRPTVTPTLAPTAEPPQQPPTETPTVVPTSTLEPIIISLVNTSAVHKTSTRFVLDFSASVGTYHAVANFPGGGPIQYDCAFDPAYLNHLVCVGGTIPFNVGAYTMLYRDGVDAPVYSNLLFYRGIVATPVGIACEVEPQWGYPPNHDFAPQGCYAVTCYLNSVFFWGSNNTCDKEWPFEWKYTYP